MSDILWLFAPLVPVLWIALVLKATVLAAEWLKRRREAKS